MSNENEDNDDGINLHNTFFAPSHARHCSRFNRANSEQGQQSLCSCGAYVLVERQLKKQTNNKKKTPK